MKKILYLMNVDWNWIKQRPHFIAESLLDQFEVIVVNQRRYSHKGFQNRDFAGKMKQINAIPRIDRYKYLRNLNTLIKQIFIKKVVANEKPKYIYATLPEQINWLPNNYTGKIIYDCMDDHYGLMRDESKKKQILIDEKKLIDKVDYVFVSSVFLLTLLKQRYGTKIQGKATVIRNGFGGEIINPKIQRVENDKLVLAYFGTISDWFDFELLEKSLEKNDFIEYLLIGPLHREVTIPKNEKIKYIGTVEHDKLYDAIKDVDCFIMPFILDDSIRAVDPVKLYEYINFNKNIVCVYYPEVRRFADFASFYTNYEEFEMIIRTIHNDNSIKYDAIQRLGFLKNNSWSSRGAEITRILNGGE